MSNNSLVELVARVEARAPRGQRHVVAISGPPGSGKTTIAAEIAVELCARGHRAVQVAMDGFHYYRRELDAMPEPDKAHRFRGAPFTFDLPRVREFSAKLHTREPIVCPSFDHAQKDPKPDGTTILPEDDIIIFEGNYLLLNEWDLKQYWDDRWLLSVDEATLRDRLAARHLKAGLVDSLEKGYDRADFNDVPNGRLILKESSYDVLIQE